MVIHTLYEHEIDDFRNHLKRLTSNDRYLRFGRPISDEVLDKHVDTLIGSTGCVKGFYDNYNQLKGAVEIRPGGKICELALSIEDDHKGRGLGEELFREGLQWAQNRGYEKVYVLCLSQNKPMKKIARKFKGNLVTDIDETEAFVEIKSNPWGLWTELMQDNVGHWLKNFNAFVLSAR